LDVYGSVCSAINGVPSGVDLHGGIRNLTPVLHRAALAIAPLRAGSGLKIKLLDYFAHGLAVVTTSAGAAGFEPAIDATILIADSAQAFADAIATTLAASAECREAAALAYAARYTAETTFAGLAAALGV
jgi:glycosyltransferase involved in cell wall biosynthesis